MPDIKIRISKGEQTAGDGQEIQEQKQQASKERIAVVSVLATQMVGIAKQSINYALNNVGVNTGNYVLQEQINNAMDVVSDVATIGLGFGAGGIVGGLIAIAGVTTKTVFSEISRNTAIRHENLRNDYLLARSGNSAKNGSRGTEN